eukprot:403337889
MSSNQTIHSDLLTQDSDQVQNQRKQRQQQPQTQRMPLKDKLVLGPIEKYQRYNRFPYKLLTQIALVFFTTIQVEYILSETSFQNSAQQIVFYHMFLDPQENYNGDIPSYKNLFNFKEFHKLVDDSINRFFALEDDPDSLEDYEYIYLNGNKVLPTAYMYYTTQSYDNQAPLHFTLEPGNLGYFSQDYIDNGELKILPEQSPAEANCYDWTVNQQFRFAQHSAIQVKLKFNRNPCSSEVQLSWNRLIWLHFLVFILALVHLILTIRYIFQIKKRYQQLKNKHKKLLNKQSPVDSPNFPISPRDKHFNSKNAQPQVQIKRRATITSMNNNDFRQLSDDFHSKKQNIYLSDQDEGSEDNIIRSFLDQSKKQKDWHELGLWDKLAIVNFWVIVLILSDFLILSGTTIFIFIEDKEIANAEIFLGFGCFFCWCSLPSYLHQTSQYSLINRTISYTLPVVLRAMSGIIPLFFGFAFLGLCLFWDSSRFKTLNLSLFTCFAMMQADSLLDIFYQITAFRFLLAIVFMLVFVFCGIVIVQNVFLIMIEHGFLGVKYSKSYDWLQNKYKDQIQTQKNQLLNRSNTIGEQGSEKHKTQVDQVSQLIDNKSYLEDGFSEFENDQKAFRQRFQQSLKYRRIGTQVNNRGLLFQNSIFSDKTYVVGDDQSTLMNLNDNQLQGYLSKREIQKDQNQKILTDLIHEESDSQND